MNAKELLAKHQWAGTAHGSYNTARKCPECNGIHPDDGLVLSSGRTELGTGHKPDCAIAAAIRVEPQSEVT
jgi:hypothetical protein